MIAAGSFGSRPGDACRTGASRHRPTLQSRHFPAAVFAR